MSIKIPYTSSQMYQIIPYLNLSITAHSAPLQGLFTQIVTQVPPNQHQTSLCAVLYACTVQTVAQFPAYSKSEESILVTSTAFHTRLPPDAILQE